MYMLQYSTAIKTCDIVESRLHSCSLNNSSLILQQIHCETINNVEYFDNISSIQYFSCY